MIKFQHTIFALPFALGSMLLAQRGLPPWQVVFWIIAACVFARTSAMSFNRWADAKLDARNPRTASRAIPAGQLSPHFVLLFTVVSAMGFVISAAMLNRLTLALSPVALLVLLGYSYCKRFTSLAHIVLGLALGIAPIGAWMAVRGELAFSPVLLGLGVLLWTTGFDLIYACQDYEVDRREGLHSLPARAGILASLLLSKLLHAACIGVFALAGALLQLHWPYFTGAAAMGLVLIAGHLAINPRDLSRITLAFFTLNSWVGILFFIGIACDLLLYK